MFQGHANFGKPRLTELQKNLTISSLYGKDPYGKSRAKPLKRKVRKMSGALWCDQGNHPFSIKDPDRQHFTKTATQRVPRGNSYGSTVYQDEIETFEEFDICGPCWKKQNPFHPAHAEIPQGVGKEEYTKFLEKEAGLNE